MNKEKKYYINYPLNYTLIYDVFRLLKKKKIQLLEIAFNKLKKIMDIIIKVMLFCIYFIEWNSNLNIYFIVL